jgi:S-adenosylmethionine:tRNA ribosyltransferase-isomerase
LSGPTSQLNLQTAAFDYELPGELIAQTPVEPRDSARLLVLERASGKISHHVFCDLDRLLCPVDLLIANRTRVLPARLYGRRIGTGGRVEALLLRKRGASAWEALVRPDRRLPPGTQVAFNGADRSVLAEVGQRLSGEVRVLSMRQALEANYLLELGKQPIPPYIKAWSGDPERYQTVYGDRPGSVAASTAGLHFRPELLSRLREAGIRTEFITLHVGTDTFRPIRTETISAHQMHAEWAEVGGRTLVEIDNCRRRGGRVVAVGTTTVRALETAIAAGNDHAGKGWSGRTSLYITPGFRFRGIDALITNFHLPRSTLLVLVSAFAGREAVLAAYREAIARRYRFYSFGDSMLVL